MIKSYNNFTERMRGIPGFRELADFFFSRLPEAFNTEFNGNLPKWINAYKNLPDLQPEKVCINCPVPSASGGVSAEERAQLESALKELHPWRKGPFSLFDIYIDAEWRSDWKWERLSEHFSDWKGKDVLDIGCGNGYHMFRAAASGARIVIGIDTSLLSIMQFKSLQKYLKVDNAEIFPAGIQHIPANLHLFDIVLSMGILYHRKDHAEHLLTLKNLLKPGGTCVLETLVIEGDDESCLVPEKRYAMMKNVYAVPSVPLLEKWCSDAGFKHIQTVDVTATTVREQRSTEWMTFHSLPEFLNPEDHSETVEGYPAPRRAIILLN